jgi:hypothetical protein
VVLVDPQLFLGLFLGFSLITINPVCLWDLHPARLKGEWANSSTWFLFSIDQPSMGLRLGFNVWVYTGSPILIFFPLVLSNRISFHRSFSDLI